MAGGRVSRSASRDLALPGCTSTSSAVPGSTRRTPLAVVGIDDASTGHSDHRRAFRGARRRGSRLVLTHVPNVADRAAEYGPSLIFAGHTHGGHVRIPGLTARIARRFGNNYLAGFYRVGDSLLYVNCGIGSSSVPIRAGAPSEVSLFTLRFRDTPYR